MLVLMHVPPTGSRMSSAESEREVARTRMAQASPSSRYQDNDEPSSTSSTLGSPMDPRKQPTAGRHRQA